MSAIQSSAGTSQDEKIGFIVTSTCRALDVDLATFPKKVQAAFEVLNWWIASFRQSLFGGPSSVFSKSGTALNGFGCVQWSVPSSECQGSL